MHRQSPAILLAVALALFSVGTGQADSAAGGVAATGEHPRTAAAQGRLTHPRLGPDLWPRDPAARAPVRRNATDAREEAGEPIRVQVYLERSDPVLHGRVARHAARIIHTSDRHRQLTLEVDDRRRLLEIADIDGVRAVERDQRPITHAGSITSRAPRALKVDEIPPGLLLDGTGTMLGIFSDSFARTDAVRTDATQPEACPPDTSGGPVSLTGLQNQQSGDLPGQIEVFADNAPPDTCGSAAQIGLFDEGAAMAELAYDIAPATDISFHTAFISQASFAEGFETLCRPESEGGAGATIVVDDVLWPTEPMYQPGPIAEAATACVDGGVPVFSAAGNSAGNALRATYVDVDPGNEGGFGDDFHDWGDGSGLLPIDVPATSDFLVVLQWNQPFGTLSELESGGYPEIDLDLYLFDDPRGRSQDLVTACEPSGFGSSRVECASERDQVADSDAEGLNPWEIIAVTGLEAGRYYLAVDHFAGSKNTIPQDDATDLEFRLVFLGFDEGTIGGADSLPGPGGPSSYGHATADGVIGVGAVPWWTTPAFDREDEDSPTNDIDMQPFSAVGGELPAATFAGDGRFVGRSLAQRPQISAVDANRNTFFGGPMSSPYESLPATTQDDAGDDPHYFFGTSAAAPNAAAVGLLLAQYVRQVSDGDERLSPRALERILADTAVDVTGFRASTGVDSVSGAGLIDAEAMLERFPVAAAGRDRDIAAGEEFVLDGRGSLGGENAISEHAWSQTAGPDVSLTDADTATARFRAPDEVGAQLSFRLEVEDETGGRDTDTVRLVVAALPPEPDEEEPGDGEPGEDTSSPGQPSGGGGCFIATAAYGSDLAPELDHLRRLRDDFLLTTATGHGLVALYYHLSPPAADWLRQRPQARSAVRAALVPVVFVAARPLEGSVFVLLLLISLFCVRQGVSPRRRNPET